MSFIKKYLILILCLLFPFVVNAESDSGDPSCTYKMKDGNCEESLKKDFVMDKNFTAIIYISKKDKAGDFNYETKSLPKVYINGFPVTYSNNLSKKESSVLNPGLKSGGSDVSAIDFYPKNGCPEYFAIDVGSSGYYTGYFANKYMEPNGYMGCIFKLDKQGGYDKDFERKNEIYNCKLYSSDIYHKDKEVAVSIDYTEKTISFGGNEVTDSSEEAKKAMKKYIQNFDYTQKEKCPKNDLKICFLGDWLYLYPSDFKDTITTDCAILDSTKKLEVGDSYCKYFVEKRNEFKSTGNPNAKSDLIDFCRLILSNNNYTAEKDSCLRMCLDLSEFINTPQTDDDGECNLSGRMINWIKNIMKWIKYILPVVVIILGILDFIKAIASSSDDEMKKAQGRFIKRLIAAALLFLIPALIEFILEVFNIESTLCGII